jgi:WD40 repeat protein
VSFSRAGTLAFAGDDATVRLWGFNKQDALLKILSGQSKSVSGMSSSQRWKLDGHFLRSPDGQTIAPASAGTAVKLLASRFS